MSEPFDERAGSRGDQGEWPRIALVTPVWNSARYLEMTIRSVLAQGYPNLDYVIVDGGSTDGSVDIIRKYEKHISGWISEPDKGMYDAVNKGFAQTSGDIMGWISATDMLHIGGLKVAGGVFRDLPQVEWITGRRTVFNDAGMTVRIDPVMHWSRYRFLIAASWRHIQQESTYWRRSMWEKAGGYVDATARYASDFELWIRFFRHAHLYSVDSLIGGFREHPDSDSLGNLTRYNSRCDQLAEQELQTNLGWFKRFRRYEAAMKRLPLVRDIWARGQTLVLDNVYTMKGSDFPPVIEAGGSGWTLRPISRVPWKRSR